MNTFRKKPVVIEAIQWSGSNWHELYAWAGHEVSTDGSDTLLVHTIEGSMSAPPGWWIIKGIKGEFYPCEDEIFRATYEAVDGIYDGDDLVGYREIDWPA